MRSQLRVAQLERETPIIVLQLCSVKKLDKAALIVAVVEMFNALDAQYGVDDAAQDNRSDLPKADCALLPPRAPLC